MDDFEALFAKIAVDRGFLTSSQTVECIREFDAQQGKSLGEIFVEKGHITPLQLREILQGRREVMLAEDDSQLAQARRLVDQLRAVEAPPPQPQPHPPAQPEADTSGSVPGPAVSGGGTLTDFDLDALKSYTKQAEKQPPAALAASAPPAETAKSAGVPPPP